MAKPVNKAKFNYQTLIRSWPADTRKKLKPDPAPLLEKWGQVQVQLDKTLTELLALDKLMNGQVFGINHILDDLHKFVPAEDQKSWELFRKLLAEYHRSFCKSVVERLAQAAVHHGAQ